LTHFGAIKNEFFILPHYFGDKDGDFFSFLPLFNWNCITFGEGVALGFAFLTSVQPAFS
jgi:hypothetical protein